MKVPNKTCMCISYICLSFGSIYQQDRMYVKLLHSHRKLNTKTTPTLNEFWVKMGKHEIDMKLFCLKLVELKLTPAKLTQET